MSRKSLIFFALGLLALALYAAGLKTGTFIIFAAAVLVELWFWLKIIKSRKKQKTKTE